VSIIKIISNMHIQEYEGLINSLQKKSQRNLKKLEEYRDKNTFLQSLISN